MIPIRVVLRREGRSRWQADAEMPDGSVLNVSLGHGDIITAEMRAEQLFPECKRIDAEVEK